MSPSPATDRAPLTAPVFQILLSLVDEDLHGYALIQDIRDRTDGEVRLTASTLYTAIRRLVAADLIEEVARPRGEKDDPRRRYYRIAPAGLAALREELGHMEAVVRRTKALRLKPSGSA